ncbi:hypothetical protein LXA43DRAFT_1063363 [Ganoderma leucocontextum]|nr:hypothetical protein LXA43DRAFT_1063363 [Ganoderma leucocontextum]
MSIALSKCIIVKFTINNYSTDIYVDNDSVLPQFQMALEKTIERLNGSSDSGAILSGSVMEFNEPDPSIESSAVRLSSLSPTVKVDYKDLISVISSLSLFILRKVNHAEVVLRFGDLLLVTMLLSKLQDKSTFYNLYNHLRTGFTSKFSLGRILDTAMCRIMCCKPNEAETSKFTITAAYSDLCTNSNCLALHVLAWFIGEVTICDGFRVCDWESTIEYFVFLEYWGKLVEAFLEHLSRMVVTHLPRAINNNKF